MDIYWYDVLLWVGLVIVLDKAMHWVDIWLERWKKEKH